MFSLDVHDNALFVPSLTPTWPAETSGAGVLTFPLYNDDFSNCNSTIKYTQAAEMHIISGLMATTRRDYVDYIRKAL